MAQELKPSIVPPGAGRVMTAFGDTLTVKLAGAQTGGTLALAECITPPGGGPPLHCHQREDELFQVLEGRVSFFAEGKWAEHGPGAVVFLPRGRPHTFKNSGSTPARLMVMVQPAGFEVFFEKCAAEFNQAGGPDMSRIMAIAGEHGLEILGPPPA